MSMQNSTIKIVDGKVVFSQEIIDYFENLRTEENSEWIDKYFKTLSNVSNINSEKYHFHHIRPCITFKDEIHTNRKQTKPLGDNFNGNLIKLSIYNHLFAHFYLWKIFNDDDSKTAFQYMCNQRKYIDNLTEKELDKIARLKEECVKEKLTEEEKKKHKLQAQVNYRKNNKDILKKKNEEYCENNHEKRLQTQANYRKNNKDKIKLIGANYRKNNKDKIKKKNKEYRENNKEKISNFFKLKNSQQCYDPKKENFCTLGALRSRKNRNKELYKDVIPSAYII